MIKKDPEPIYNYDDYVMDLKVRLQRLYLSCRQKIVQSKIRSKKFYDKNSRLLNLKVGNLVWLKDEARKDKFSSLKKGPYKVVEILSPENTAIKIKNKIVTVHNNRLVVGENSIVEEE